MIELTVISHQISEPSIDEIVGSGGRRTGIVAAHPGDPDRFRLGEAKRIRRW